MAIDFREAVTHLRRLATEKPSAERRAEVQRALDSRFEGVQAVGAEVLGAWADQESVVMLQEWLDRLLGRPRSMGARGVAVRELAHCAGLVDADWVLDRYFGARDHLLQHELLPLASTLPPPSIRSRVQAAAKDNHPRMRLAALKLILTAPFQDRATLVAGFLADPDKLIRKVARAGPAA
jgi:hypothetical protein